MAAAGSAGHSDQDRWESEREASRRDRGETPAQQLDRNFMGLLQELRVAQTGVQILFAFLLTLAFSARFSSVHGLGMVVYIATVLCAALATCFLIGPVAAHRLLFRRRAMEQLVALSHRLTLAGLALLGLSVTGAIILVLEVSLGWLWGWLLGALVAVVFSVVWVWVPLRLRADAQLAPNPT